MNPATVNAVLRTDFVSFLQKCFATLHPGKTLTVEWMHRAMAYALAQCAAGAAPQSIITMPPRSLKSVTFSVAWPAWLLGHDPTVKIMCVSYGDEPMTRFSRDCRSIMQSSWYCELFPATVLVKATETDLETSMGGTRLAKSVNGSLTGFGGEWIILDDPMNALDVRSKEAREKAIDRFRLTLANRLNDKATGKIIVVMQRLHEGDLVGFLLEIGGWTELRLPAKAVEDEDIPIGPGQFYSRKEGELLQPTREPQEVLDRYRALMGPSDFEAQYQQAPIPDAGNVVKREWIQFYMTLPDRSRGRIVLSIDTAQKVEPSNDYTVITVWLWIDNDHYLLDVHRERCDYPRLRNLVLERWDSERAERMLIEEGGSATALIQELRAHRGEIIVVPIRATESKSVRVGTASGLFQNHRVHFPKDASWLPETMAEVLGFPGAKHDDIIDSISQYLNWVRTQQGSGRFDCDWMRRDEETPLSALLQYGSRLGSPRFGQLF